MCTTFWILSGVHWSSVPMGHHGSQRQTVMRNGRHWYHMYPCSNVCLSFCRILLKKAQVQREKCIKISITAKIAKLDTIVLIFVQLHKTNPAPQSEVMGSLHWPQNQQPPFSELIWLSFVIHWRLHKTIKDNKLRETFLSEVPAIVSTLTLSSNEACAHFWIKHCGRSKVVF